MALTTSVSFEIFEGVETPAEEELVLLGTGSDGDPTAKRVLTHPTSASFAPITYWRNPDRTSNLDNDVIALPRAQVVGTEDTSGVVLFDQDIDDMTVVEVWEGGPRRASIPTDFWRLLHDYVKNQPPISYTAQTYVTYEPRDKNEYVYNVIVFRLEAGGAGQTWVTDLIPPQGEIGGGMQDSDFPGSGVLLEEIRLYLKIVSKVT